MHAKLLQLCPTLCDPMVRSLPGSSAHGILQARTLEWVAMPSPGDRLDPGMEPASFMPLCHWQAGALPLEPPASPSFYISPG